MTEHMTPEEFRSELTRLVTAVALEDVEQDEKGKQRCLDTENEAYQNLSDAYCTLHDDYAKLPKPRFGVGDEVWQIGKGPYGVRRREKAVWHVVCPPNKVLKVRTLQDAIELKIEYETDDRVSFMRWKTEGALYATASEAQTECDRRNEEAEQ